MAVNLYDIFEQAKEMAVNEASNIDKALGESRSVGEASPEKCNKVIEGIAKELGSNAQLTHIFFVVSFLLQRGATSDKTPGTTKIAYGTATVTVEMIKKHCRTEKITARQFARGLKQKIAEFMLTLGAEAPEGNLAKTMKLEIKNPTKEELIWASDFQTYNENCPARVKNWLVKNYRQRFRSS